MRWTPRRTIIIASSAALLTACRQRPVPNQVLTKPAPVTRPAPEVRNAGPWVYRPATMPQHLVIDDRAVVTVGLDTAARIDTLTSHAEVSFASTPVPRGVSGTVAAFLVGSDGRATTTPAGLHVPFSFSANYGDAGVQLAYTAPRDGTPCSSMELAAMQSLRDLWFEPPDTLRVGSTWSDSASYVTCRDGIPLRSVVRRMFHISSAAVRDGRLLISIERLSRTRIDGHGTQFGDSVSVSGSSNGLLTYDFDPALGEVTSASGSNTLELSLRGTRRMEIVRQAAEIRIGRS